MKTTRSRLRALSVVLSLGALAACATEAETETERGGAPSPRSPDDAAELAAASDTAGVERGESETTASVGEALTAVPSVAEVLAAVPPGATPYRGVNLSGADFGSALPGKEWVDYVFPPTSEVDYYLGKGMNTFRVGFQWERLQRSAKGSFDATYASKLDALVRYATTKGGYVVLNPQNFARYYGQPVGSAAVPNAVFSDLWRRLAAKYKGNARVLFGLVNEPNTMPTEQWVGAANAAIVAIRKAGASNVVLAPGNAWTGAHSWYDSWYGTSNAVAMLAVKDPGNNTLFEAHQYLDSDSSGSSATCVSSTIGRQRLAPFVKWLRANNKRGFVGELAGARNATCYAAVKDMLTYVAGQSDVLVGWAWWGGGPWWGEYRFTLEPLAGVDRPQMGVIAPFLASPRP
jgi:endoglucanase